MKHEIGEIKKVVRVGQINNDFFAYVLCIANGKEFYRTIPHQSWPIHHLAKVIGMKIMFVQIKKDRYDVIPLNFQPLFVTFEFMQILINHGAEDFLDILRKADDSEEKCQELDIEQRLRISMKEIELFQKYINKKKKDIDDEMEDIEDGNDFDDDDGI